MPSTVNITIQNDSDFYKTFQYTLSDGVTPIPLTGDTFIMGVRRTMADTQVLFEVTSSLTAAGQISIIDGPNGKFNIWIPKTQILAAPLGTWYHSLLLSSPAANNVPALLTTIWNGTLTINPGASR